MYGCKCYLTVMWQTSQVGRGSWSYILHTHRTPHRSVNGLQGLNVGLSCDGGSIIYEVTSRVSEQVKTGALAPEPSLTTVLLLFFSLRFCKT